MATYDSLHRQCRTLESLFDTKLTSYARLASTISRPGVEDVEAEGSTARVQDVEQDVQELLEKVSSQSFKYCLTVSYLHSAMGAPQLGEANDQLSTLANDTENPPSQSMLRAIQRHRDVYQDYVRELRRTKVCSQDSSSQYEVLLTWVSIRRM